MNDPRRCLKKFTASARRRVRGQRAIDAAVIAGLAVCAVAIAPIVFVLASRPTPWWWSLQDLSWAIAAATSLAAVVATLFPLRAADVVRIADRRLGLEDALITSTEVLDSRDPVCRLLVRRTALAAARIPVRQAVPLRLPTAAVLLPAIVAAAVAISIQPRPVAPTAAHAPGAGVTVESRLSRELQETVASVLSVDARPSDSVLKTVRELLAIDEALRRGALEPSRARALAAASVAALQEESGMPGPLPSVTFGDVSRDRSPARGPGSSRLPDAGTSGAGRGAGRGTATLRARREATPTEQVSAAATWTFPPPFRSSGGGIEQVDRVEVDPDAPGVRERTPLPLVSHLQLTPVERAIVSAYLERVRREGEP